MEIYSGILFLENEKQNLEGKTEEKGLADMDHCLASF